MDGFEEELKGIQPALEKLLAMLRISV